MAKCDTCNKEMDSDRTFTCTERWFVKTDQEIDQGPIIFVKRAEVYLDDEQRCNDCNIAYGGFHHPGCDRERCPFCENQLITCGCEFIVMTPEEMIKFVAEKVVAV